MSDLFHSGKTVPELSSWELGPILEKTGDDILWIASTEEEGEA
jgi:hypothetical protein